jgi:hypothetical protein
MGDPKSSPLVQQDHPTVTFQATLQVKDRFLGHRVRRSLGLNPVSRPFGQDQLHDGFTPTGAGDGGALVIGITAAADQ